MSIWKILALIFGSKQDRDMKKLRPILAAVNEKWEIVKKLSDEELKNKTQEFRERLTKGETLDDILPEAYSVVREATYRVLGERKIVKNAANGNDIPYMAHFDVQILAAIALHQGNIAEMKTGEGKTQVAPVAAYLNALSQKGVHIITVNDYLAKRDSEWMGNIFSFLGMSVGCLDKTEPSTQERRDAYNCDITYGTNNEFGFDYLRDNMAIHYSHCVQRELNYAIIDEVDNILIDEARTPLIISGAADVDNKEYEELQPLVRKLVEAQRKLMSENFKKLKEKIAKEEFDEELGLLMLVAKRGEPKNQVYLDGMKNTAIAKVTRSVEQEYLIEKKLHEIDEKLYFSIEENNHSAEMSEKGRELIGGNNKNFFVVTDLAVIIGEINSNPNLSLEEKNEFREKAHVEFSDRSERIHCVNQLLKAFALYEKDVNYVVQDGQVLIVDEFTGRILPGRRWSDGLHQAVEAKEGVKVAGESQTLATITFQNFFKMYNKIAGMTGTAATEAKEFADIYKLDVIQIPTNREVARIDADDEIYKTQKEKYEAVVKEIRKIQEKGAPVLVGTVSIEKSEYLSRMLEKNGIRHEVLNAKNHAREASIIAQAGKKGAVTIATNMAGRGTDIKLGGNFEAMAKDKLRMDGEDPETFSNEDMLARYPELAEEIANEQDEVLQFGGLYVLGTERHESRRIDNQLRGRSGRQGDPGLSKFYLSLDDDLMRIFGSDRMAGILDKIGVSEGETISHPMLTGAIGNAQRKVEGRNFEIRKHLKEYDDVMNFQRSEIYGLRKQILFGNDITKEIQDQFAMALEDVILKNCDNKDRNLWNITELELQIASIFGVIIDKEKYNFNNISIEELFDGLWAEVKTIYENKESRVGAQHLRELERRVLLASIDDLWKNHLYEMDHLKQSAHYASFGQKNPLFEYQKEGLKLFETLRANIAKKTANLLYRLEMAGNIPQRRQQRVVEIHANAGQAMQNVSQRAKPTPPQMQQIRQFPKVGRNDLCPCGSGKKYKKCHGSEL
ncbi:MAG: preprotein translocase subunit SecA [Chitinispirillales bacterium]|jgi:preprotein translocase subunit SecA|nr:preprotein translocase subunit SecA [Chitinispirillales bacterium]